MGTELSRTKHFIILIYLAFVLILIFLLGITYGTIFVLGTWISLVLIYFLNLYTTNQNSSDNFQKFRKIIVIGLISFYITFFCIEALIIKEWSSDIYSNSNVDYAIILGAGLDGDKISNTVKSRLDAAYEYLQNNKSVKVIVSGGHGQGEIISEAEAMGKYLIKKGISSQRILYEDKSTTTKQNIKFSNNIASSHSERKPKLLIITSDYHMLRAKLICQQLNLDYYGKASTSPFFVRINYSIREYFAFIKEYVSNFQP